MYKLAIFDFDGTLVDSTPGIVDVMKIVIDEYKFEPKMLDEWSLLVGVPLPKQMEIILPDRDADFHLEVANRYRAIYDTMAVEICPPFADMMPMLETLQSEGVTITIATSKRRNLVEVVLDHHKITDMFKMVVGAQDVTNHKPHPESVHQTIQKLGIPIAETVVIGDSVFDLDMARNAGADAIGVTTGIHTREMLAKSEPRHIVGNLDEVGKLILKGKH
ncbi:MAG: HAD family hydrolase [Candidatus Melainabacteria bacterium]|jgi:phosphoglycolate phosphatase|nr:HAD family hydrolase [Candidatus Melainabacteria bacterium]MBX9673048.1 HAD family hydrolase [Candidatus Obscuribacterales bacterium]